MGYGCILIAATDFSGKYYNIEYDAQYLPLTRSILFARIDIELRAEVVEIPEVLLDAVGHFADRVAHFGAEVGRQHAEIERMHQVAVRANKCVTCVKVERVTYSI